jgi:hypothetical protein
VYGSFSQTAVRIFSDSSIFGFYRGATFRYGRMAVSQKQTRKFRVKDVTNAIDSQLRFIVFQCAVFIMDLLKEKVGYALYPEAFA